jgi:hypothetical protein
MEWFVSRNSLQSHASGTYSSLVSDMLRMDPESDASDEEEASSRKEAEQTTYLVADTDSSSRHRHTPSWAGGHRYVRV